MDVTAATADDVAPVAELWVALAREQRAHGSHLRAEENRQRARDLVAQYVHSDTCAVARTAGQPVGFVMFHVESGYFQTDATRGVIDNVYVLPAARDEGVGSALLDYAEAELRERGADVLALEALRENDAVRRLYERRGYAPHRVTMEKRVGDGDREREDGDAADADET